MHVSKFTHSYPHDWRTKKPVIYRATPQWFASVEMFRDELLDAVKATEFTPAWGETRLYNMIRDRGDWVISRQRAWGVPIPIFYAEDETPIITPETIAHISKLFREHGSNIWFRGQKRKTCFQKALHMKVARTASLLKRTTLWTYGSTQDHLTKVCL